MPRFFARPLSLPPLTRGQVVLIALVFFAAFFAVATALLASITTDAHAEHVATARAQARAGVNGGIDLAVAKLNADPSYAGGTLTLGSAAVTVSVSTIDSSTKNITVTASAPAGAPYATEVGQANVSINNSVVAFRYGVQAGAGGFNLSGGATINGSVYANGSIHASSGVKITGSAIAADPPAVAADQSNGASATVSSCTATNCITFANSNATQDLAQSFVISSAEPLNSISFYLEKVGNPSDITVRIVNDNGGAPGNTQLMSATLPASSVSSVFGWVTVALPSTPVLSAGETYWVVLDTGANSSKYYVSGANANGYPSGTALLGKYGGSTWSSTGGLDAFFQLYLGGGTSLIGGTTNLTGVYVGTTGSDEAWANTVEGATMSGPLYCQTASNTNEACDTSRPDPPPETMPVSDGNINGWEAEAAAGGTTVGNVTVGWAGATIGPQVITGNLLVDGGGTLTVNGTLYVKGSLTLSGGGIVRLAAGYGSSDGAIVVDGTISVSGGGGLYGSGSPGSYPFLLSTSDCPTGPTCGGADAVSLTGGAGAVVIAAENGTVSINGGGALKSVSAKEIDMSGGATLTYDSGLANSNFSSGPGASWTFVPGTFSITP